MIVTFPATAVKNEGHNSQYHKNKKEPPSEFLPVLRQEMRVSEVEMSPDIARVITTISNSTMNPNIVHEVITMLEELKTLRAVRVRPATNYLSNTVPVQMQKVEEEFREVTEAINKFLDGQRPFGSYFDRKHDAMQELMDLQGACETAIHIIEPDRESRISEKIQHFVKDDVRGYFD